MTTGHSTVSQVTVKVRPGASGAAGVTLAYRPQTAAPSSTVANPRCTAVAGLIVLVNRSCREADVGEVAFGRYRLVELLGRGGMGEVWRAHDTAIGRIVALKVLPADFADDPVFQERFRREAHAAAGLDEPHVVPIYDFGEIDGRLFVTMRLIKGRDLQTILAGGPLSPARAVAIIEQVAQALHAAHRVGLVHRDIKPSNILLDENDFAYLIDFGIARAAGETGLTSTGMTIGTWTYMAPERFQSGTADARADIYALACVLYEALTGRPPFPGDSLEQIAVAHMLQPPPRPSRERAGVPAAMDDVIATGMAKNPDQRYATTVELARAAHDATTVPLPRPGPTFPAPPPTRPASMPLRPPPQQPPTDGPEPFAGRPPTTQIGPPSRPPSRSYPGSVLPSPSTAQPPVEPGPTQLARPASPRPAATDRQLKRWIVPAAALAVMAVVGGGLAIWQGTRPSTTAPIRETPAISSTTTSGAPTISSTTTSAIPAIDFHDWQPFGGIDAKTSEDGRSVVLDTHDTTQNWKAVWSGLIAAGPSQCSIRITGRARDISHSWGVPGGFGIGLTTLQRDSSGQQAPYGSAVQYDFGLEGYAVFSYPSAVEYGHTTASLDHEWHNFGVSIDAQGGITAQIDGNTVVQAQGSAVCGMPTIRVWAGSAEFRDFSVQP
jgi:serine/threonine protein kinase